MNEHYFMGTKTKEGFKNTFGNEISDKDYFGYILKGGAGTGKSSLMKAIASAFEGAEDIALYHCSSDPDSLDAVVLKNSKVYICDGTAPHVMECIYPGVTEKILNLGEYWNEKLLQAHKQEIMISTDENAALHQKATALQDALSALYSNIFTQGSRYLLREKLLAFSKRFVRKHLTKQKDQQGSVTVRQLSALTEYGYMTYTETLESFDSIYVMKDSFLSASAELVSSVMQQALSLGYDVIVSPSPLAHCPYEHILIPAAGFALISETPLSALSDLGELINMNRFYDRDTLKAVSREVKLDTAMLKDLAETLYDTIGKAKRVHDEIESYYIAAMDFSSVKELTDELIYEIRSKER
ncbi:MAG: ATPase [Ruminococcus sp.]|nr:ATPase [Ruminococcus sp.]